MKIEITAQPVFWLQISLEQIRLLSRLAEMHYDATCRSMIDRADSRLGRKNGILTIWHDTVVFAKVHPNKDEQGNIEPSRYCCAHMIDLDLCMKLMEMTEIFENKETFLVINKMRGDFCDAMRTANREIGKITYVLEGS